ncbi:MAG TPA: hypothetical protein VGE97_11005 [Nitrososphaera sp.]
MRSKKNEQKCVICGRPIVRGRIKQKVGEDYFTVDKKDCANILNRFYSAYGHDFCVMLKG